MKITVSHHFHNITENLESDLKKLVSYNIDHKLDTYLKSYHADAECRIHITLHKTKQTLYTGSLSASIDGTSYNFHIDENTPFKNPDDAISHLFTHLKESISKQKT